MAGINLSEWVPGRLTVYSARISFSPPRAILLRQGFHEGHAARHRGGFQGQEEHLFYWAPMMRERSL